MKVLYSQSKGEVKVYPRSDEKEIAGLDADYLVLEVVDTPIPEYDPTTQRAISYYLADVSALQYKQVWEIQTPPLQADWVAFNLLLFSDVVFGQYAATANQVNALIVPAIITNYNGVRKGGQFLIEFATYWGIFCQQLSVTEEHRGVWATYAESCHLPPDFVSLIRGTVSKDPEEGV